MLKELDLRNSPYYYRLADRIDSEGFVHRITVEDWLLTNDLVSFLTENGYEMQPKDEERYTTCFIAKEG